MDDSYLTQDGGGRRPKDNLFLWTVFILLLTGFAFACWIGSYYVFGQPENPKSYRILQKLKKVEPPRRFELTAAPPGEFLNAGQLFERYRGFSTYQLQRENAELIRNYINNYQATKKLVPYVIGRFTILEAFEMKGTDIFPSGVVAVAQSADMPQVVIEQAFTAPAETVPKLMKLLQPGLELKLERSVDLTAVLSISRNDDGRYQFTVVPLLYGSYALRQGSGVFSLEPPGFPNLDTGTPIIRGEQWTKLFANIARKSGGGIPKFVAKTGKSEPTATPTPAPASVMAMRDEPPAGVTIATPEVVSTPVPAQTPPPKAVAVATPVRPGPAATPSPAAVAVATPAPVATPLAVAVKTPTPSQVAAATPAPTPAAVAAASGVPLQPFLAAMPSPPVGTSATGSWRTYSPGQMPRGKLVDVGELPDMVERGVGGERVYLRGEFTVTAVGENRAVLRTPSGGRQGATRVIAEFPTGAALPKEGTAIARDENRPFQITDVRRGADGQINVYVREIVGP